jgi:hypothetical protein
LPTSFTKLNGNTEKSGVFHLAASRATDRSDAWIWTRVYVPSSELDAHTSKDVTADAGDRTAQAEAPRRSTGGVVEAESVTLINCGVNSGRVTACRSPKFLVISIAPCSLNHPRSHRPLYAFASSARSPSNTLTQSYTSVTFASPSPPHRPRIVLVLPGPAPRRSSPGAILSVRNNRSSTSIYASSGG